MYRGQVGLGGPRVQRRVGWEGLRVQRQGELGRAACAGGGVGWGGSCVQEVGKPRVQRQGGWGGLRVYCLPCKDVV